MVVGETLRGMLWQDPCICTIPLLDVKTFAIIHLSASIAELEVKELKELKVKGRDNGPCSNSGHLAVFALAILTRIRLVKLGWQSCTRDYHYGS